MDVIAADGEKIGKVDHLQDGRIKLTKNDSRLMGLRALKISTFNINNGNKRLANLLAWLDEIRPDAVCLQELKAVQAAFPEAPG